MSSTTNFIFHCIKGYMFRPYNQVIIRPTSKLSLQMLEVGVRYSVLLINSLLLTITLHSSVITTLVYNDTKYSVLCMML